MNDEKEIYDVDDFQYLDSEKNQEGDFGSRMDNPVGDNEENNKENKDMDETYESVNQNEDVDNSKNKIWKRKKRLNKSGGIKIAIAIILCSILGGIVGSGATYLVFKNNNLLGSNQNINNGPTYFETNNEVLTTTEAFERVAPAVVVVSNKSIKEYGGFIPSEEVEGIGSGFIINEEGYIITNYHVIEGASEVTVTLSDEREVKAKIVNYDTDQDIAMLKITESIEVPAVVELGDSDALRPGEELIAIGTPLSKDFSQTVTKGIVSAVNRIVETSEGVKLELIQTDTPINPGNSGGPLVNNKGQVVGINTMKLSGEVEGMGFAIPINKVEDKIEILSKPIIQLGITVREIDEETAKKYNLQEGLYIVDVAEFSSAEKAGLKSGDLITKFDGQRIKTFTELKSIKDTKNIGDVVKVEIVREKKEKIVDITLSDQE